MAEIKTEEEDKRDQLLALHITNNVYNSEVNNTRLKTSELIKKSIA